MKQKKLISCHNYSLGVNPNYKYNFGGQRSYKSNTKFPNKKIPSYYDLQVFGKKPDYSRHSFYPGQKIWIIRRDSRNGQYSVDWDHIHEMFAFGEIGSGALFHYWLWSYGTGHGVDAGDLYLTKQQALNNIRLFNITRPESYICRKIENIIYSDLFESLHPENLQYHYYEE